MLSFLFKHSRALLAFSLGSGLASGLATAGLLAVVHAALDGKHDHAHLAYAFAALCIGMPVTRLISQNILMRLGHKATLVLRLRLAGQITGVSVRALERMGVHRVLATMTADISTISGGLVAVPAILLQGSVLVSCLAYMTWLSYRLMFLVLGFLVLGFLSVQFGVQKGIKQLTLARQKDDDLMKDLRGLVEGAKQLKLNELMRTRFLQEVYEPDAREFAALGYTGGSILLAAISWANLLFFLLMGLLLWIAPHMGIVHTADISGFVLVLLYMMVPLDSIGSLLPSLTTARVALRHIETMGLSFAKESEGESGAPVASPVPWGELELKGVTHTYYTDREECFTLGPIDLTILPGEIVFITGGNGSGKTSLLKILVGLYEPEQGVMLLDGKPLEEQSRGSYRQNFSAILSDYFLFERLIGSSVTEIDALAETYLVRLRLDHKVKVVNGVLSTTELSQGQRKRLALLAAYLEDKDVYVFDEWAADQDPVFKDVFYLELLPELRQRGKTVIVATHDDKYFHAADRHIKMADGRLVSLRLTSNKALNGLAGDQYAYSGL